MALPPMSDIHQLYLYDQNLPGPGKTTLEEHLRAEELVLVKARFFLVEGKLHSGSDYRDAAWLFQHGESPKDYLLAHLLAVRAVALGDPTGTYIAAATLDRYLQAIGQDQVFGTQYAAGRTSGPNGGAKASPSGSRSQEPFDSKLVPPSLRKDFCVPDLEQQGRNLIELNRGHYPDATMVAAGCNR